jgi:NADH-quinone oxidoreductase subunit E
MPVVEKYRGKKGATIPLLAEIQKSFGYLPEDALHFVAKALDMPAAELFGVATFYSMFRLEPEGKYVVRLCRGTACHVQGSALVGAQLQRYLGIPEGKTTEDGMFTLQYVACLGCCSLAPVMMVGDEVHGKLTPESAVSILETYRKKEEGR